MIGPTCLARDRALIGTDNVRDFAAIGRACEVATAEQICRVASFDRETLLVRVRKALELDAKWRQEDARYATIADRIGLLSDRDRETRTLIQAGKSNKSIAASLFLMERAVEMRRSTIMRKLQVRSVAELL